MRIVGDSLDVYKYLEPLYLDYRKIRTQNKQGGMIAFCLLCLMMVVLRYFSISEQCCYETKKKKNQKSNQVSLA